MPILFLYLVEAGQFYEVVKTDENDWLHPFSNNGV